MALVLDYEGRNSNRAWLTLGESIGPIILTFAHMNLCWQVSQWMILSVCRHPTDNFMAWTPLAWLPGTFVSQSFNMTLGAVIMFIVSCIAGNYMWQLIRGYCQHFEPGALLRDWRVWLTASLWLAWLPVPAPYAFVYLFSQWAVQVRYL